MNTEVIRAEELGITDDYIGKCIGETEKVEWRSRQNFLDYIEKNRNNMGWKIAGWVSYKTLNKWGINTANRYEYMKGVEETNYWILCKGGRYWYVRSFLLWSHSFDIPICC